MKNKLKTPKMSNNPVKSVEERLAIIDQIKQEDSIDSINNPTSTDLEIQSQKEEQLSDEEIIAMNDKIQKAGKAKVLNFLRNYSTFDASPSQMKMIADIIDTAFKQNKSIKERFDPTTQNVTINNFGENDTVVKILQMNGLR